MARQQEFINKIKDIVIEENKKREYLEAEYNLRVIHSIIICKIEVTLDCISLHATKGHFWSFLLSNII